MLKNATLAEFKEVLSTHIAGLVPAALCSYLIELLSSSYAEENYSEAIQKCTQYVFTKEVDNLLREYFDGSYHVFCSRYDKVDGTGSDYSYSCRWHLDGGIPKTLKLFIYLNSVASHGGNTLIIDQARTQKLRELEALPIEYEGRVDDLSERLGELGLSRDYQAYDLACGDALLFSPLLLAHKCRLPNIGQTRHTICYTITPPVPGLT